MATSRKSASNDPSILTYTQIVKIWDTLTAQDWLSLDGMAKHKFTESKPGDLVGLCPNPQHQDTQPSFHIYIKERHGYCYGCGYHPVNPIELLANIQKTSYQQALTYLFQSVPRIPINRAKALNQLATQQLVQLAKTVLARTCHNQLLLAIQQHLAEGKITLPENSNIPDWDNDGEPTTFSREDLKENIRFDTEGNVIDKPKTEAIDYEYAFGTTRWLIEDRKIPLETIPSLSIGIFPPLNQLLDIITGTYDPAEESIRYLGGDQYKGIEVAQAVKRFLTMDGNAIGINCTGALVFPLYKTNTHITAIKTRNPNVVKAQSFHIFSDQFEEDLGIFGLDFPAYSDYNIKAEEDKRLAIIVEGEFDALQPMAQAILTGKVHCPIYSAGGTGGSNSLETLCKLNKIDRLLLMGDSPKKGPGGASLVIAWANRLDNIGVQVFSDEAWEKLDPAGDLDDCYKHETLSIEEVESIVFNFPKSYTPIWKWAAEKATVDIEQFNEDSIREIKQAALKAGSFLHHPEDIEKYADLLEEWYPHLKAKVLKRDLSAHVPTERGFIHRIADALIEVYEPILTQENSEGIGRLLRLYHRDTKRYSIVKLDSETSVVAELQTKYGGVHKFITDEVGVPDFLPNLDEGTKTLFDMDKRLRYYVKEAVGELAQTVPFDPNLKEVKNGYHRIELDDNNTTEVLINGHHTYVMERDADNKITFNLQNSPRCKNFLNMNTENHGDCAWWLRSPDITPELLDKVQHEDMTEIYHLLYEFFNIGFSFKHQEATAKFLAALILTYPISGIFHRQILVSLTGDTNSGKSTLMGVFATPEDAYRMRDATNIKLLYTSRRFDNYTSAGVLNSAKGESILFALDEFENDSEQKGHIVSTILEATRSLTLGRATRVQGMAGGDGKTRTSNIFTPFMFASISGALKEQDQNRMVYVHMQKNPFHASPASLIRQRFTPQDMERIILAVNFGLLRHVPKILEEYRRVSIMDPVIMKRINVPIDQRFLSSFYCIFSVMSALGLDWLSFFEEYTNAHKFQIGRGIAVSNSESVFSSMLSNPVIKLNPGDKNERPHTLSEILISREKSTQLNFASAGVYFDETHQYLLFNIDQILTGLVPAHIRNENRLNTTTLRNILERHPSVVSIQDVKQSGILRNAATHMGIGINPFNTVTIDMSALIKEYTLGTQLPTESKPAEKEESEQEFVSRYADLWK